MDVSIASFMSVCLTLFLLMDPIGNVPVFSSLLHDIPVKRQRYIIVREHIIALFVILLFAFLGEGLLDILKINLHIVNVAGGTILFLIAVKMIFPQEKAAGHTMNEEPFIVPLAIPLISGPAVLAATMVFSKTEHVSVLIISVGIVLTLSLCILMSLPLLKKVLGTKFLQALEKLMGMILVIMAFEMFFDGIKGFFSI
ncbi:antibiotic transporter [Candidatus Aerophobetes bacterium]|uniref:UPF0056 membrane protein n=1 Tax=Aerophobetes bacterium TaxID=2030807 RepID=A0A2A4X6Q1_UNCAE|nr:MAG: antibiotic transporter [Candidatus Aerophobetes bacterium]